MSNTEPGALALDNAHAALCAVFEAAHAAAQPPTPKGPESLTEACESGDTDRVLAAMFRENTGVGLCDSGGTPTYGPNGEYLGSHSGYGRGFERCAMMDAAAFRARPVGEVDWRADDGRPSIVLDTFHWLRERVEYWPELDKALQEYAGSDEGEAARSWLAVAEGFAGGLAVRGNATGLYGDGLPMTVNTYNGEDALSTVLQYVYLEIQHDGPRVRKCSHIHGPPCDCYPPPPFDEGAAVLLQTHNGADVRGGYSRPVAFRVLEECALFCNANATIYCEECGAAWTSEDAGYRWAEDGRWTAHGNPFGDFPRWVRGADDVPLYVRALWLADEHLPRLARWLRGKFARLCVLTVADDGRSAACPHCGGALTPWSW